MGDIEREIARLYRQDLKERTAAQVIPEQIIQHDKERKKFIIKVIARLGIGIDKLSPKALYHIAWIFHHGMTITDAQNAKKYASLSFNRGFKKAGWLYAASTDRLLMRKGKPQKFGTQFYKASKKAKWKLYKTNPSVTDAQRAKYGVLSLDQQKKAIKQFSK